MDEQQLRALMRARDQATRPDEAFSDRLFAVLATELRLRPTERSAERRGRLSARRWLPAIGLALLTVASLGVLALLARPDGDALACDASLIEEVREAVASAPGYAYQVAGNSSALSGAFDDGFTVAGAFAAPSSVHERYEGPISPSSSEAVRVADDAWTMSAIDPSRWLEGAPARWYVELPNVTSLPANPGLFALDGLVERAPPFAWEASPSVAGPCELVGRHVWSERNQAVQVLTVSVDLETGLPATVRNELIGFMHNNENRDWLVTHTFDFAQVPAIQPPPPDQVAPTPDFGGWTPPPRQRIVREGSAVHEGLRITAGDVAELPDYEGSTAMPGNVYLQVKLRYEALEGTRPVVGAGDWQPMVEGMAPGGGIGPPYYVEGGPDFLRSDLRFSAGDVMEGWVVLEVPVSGDAVIYGFGGYADAPIEIVLR